MYILIVLYFALALSFTLSKKDGYIWKDCNLQDSYHEFSLLNLRLVCKLFPGTAVLSARPLPGPLAAHAWDPSLGGSVLLSCHRCEHWHEPCTAQSLKFWYVQKRKPHEMEKRWEIEGKECCFIFSYITLKALNISIYCLGMPNKLLFDEPCKIKLLISFCQSFHDAHLHSVWWLILCKATKSVLTVIVLAKAWRIFLQLFHLFQTKLIAKMHHFNCKKPHMVCGFLQF